MISKSLPKTFFISHRKNRFFSTWTPLLQVRKCKIMHPPAIFNFLEALFQQISVDNSFTQLIFNINTFYNLQRGSQLEQTFYNLPYQVNVSVIPSFVFLSISWTRDIRCGQWKRPWQFYISKMTLRESTLLKKWKLWKRPLPTTSSILSKIPTRSTEC